MSQRILVATGGSPWSAAAVLYAIGLAAGMDEDGEKVRQQKYASSIEKGCLLEPLLQGRLLSGSYAWCLW